jgi:quinol monooxygenase YgiN
MPLVVVVRWTAKRGEETEIARILRTMIPISRLEPGCIKYEVYQSAENPCNFLLFEIYRDEAALKTHSDSDHFKRYVLDDALPRLESRERTYYVPLSN